jgi:uncharacterized ion transporter superfamily protein YfcC
VIAVVYQVVMFVNLVWPRASVYDLTGTTWWLQWSAILFIALTIVVGAAIHLRNRTRYGSMTFVAAHLSGHAPGHPVGHLVGHPSVLVPDVEGLA